MKKTAGNKEVVPVTPPIAEAKVPPSK